MLIALVVAAFLSGSIPFGLLIGLAKGVDVRAAGSGNIGATNVGRVLGRRYFWLCFALDFLKGFAPVLAAGWMLGTLGSLAFPQRSAWGWLAVALAAVLGHVFTPWLKFRGGKGVATAVGALMGVYPALSAPALVAACAFGLALWAWRYVSLASMVAAVALPPLVVAWFVLASLGFGPHALGAVRPAQSLPFAAFTLVIAALVVWRHRGNIARLRAGTEPRLGARAAPRAP